MGDEGVWELGICPSGCERFPDLGRASTVTMGTGVYWVMRLRESTEECVTEYSAVYCFYWS